MGSNWASTSKSAASNKSRLVKWLFLPTFHRARLPIVRTSLLCGPRRHLKEISLMKDIKPQPPGRLGHISLRLDHAASFVSCSLPFFYNRPRGDDITFLFRRKPFIWRQATKLKCLRRGLDMLKPRAYNEERCPREPSTVFVG